MMLFYLQQTSPPVIPVLQEMYTGEKPEVQDRKGQDRTVYDVKEDKLIVYSIVKKYLAQCKH